MTRKQYRRKIDFIKGYKMGYQWKALHPTKLQAANPDYKRGYYEARKDFRQCEPPLY